MLNLAIQSSTESPQARSLLLQGIALSASQLGLQVAAGLLSRRRRHHEQHIGVVYKTIDYSRVIG